MKTENDPYDFDPDKMDAEKAKWIFEQVQLSLEETQDAFSTLEKKAYYRVVAWSGIFAICLQAARDSENPMIFAALATLHAALAIAMFLGALGTTQIMPKGNEPLSLLRKRLCNYDLRLMITAEAELYQERIDTNRKIGKKLGSRINTLTKLWSAILLVSGLSYVVTELWPGRCV